MSAPWWHPEATPLADIRRAVRAAELGVSMAELARLEAAAEELTVFGEEGA